jgi:hypothetical protein
LLAIAAERPAMEVRGQRTNTRDSPCRLINQLTLGPGPSLPASCLDASSFVVRLRARHNISTPSPEASLRLFRGLSRTNSGILYGRKLAARRLSGIRGGGAPRWSRREEAAGAVSGGSASSAASSSNARAAANRSARITPTRSNDASSLGDTQVPAVSMKSTCKSKVPVCLAASQP